MSFVQEILSQYREPDPQDHDELEGLPLIDEEDREILMHREVHFGQQFAIMIEHYDSEGKGAVLDRRRVKAVAQMQEQAGEDLAPMLLSGADAEKIRQVRDMYEKLRDIYESTSNRDTTAHKIADLILSEDEEEEGAIDALVASGAEVVPDLIHLLASNEFADSLFPGYGIAPTLAARCLGRIGDARAVPRLFEAVGQEDIELEEESMEALAKTGDPAKEFLLKALQTKRITRDTELAAAVLATFPPTQEIGEAAIKLLSACIHTYPMASYLALCCAGLADKSRLSELAATPELTQQIKETIEEVLKQ